MGRRMPQLGAGLFERGVIGDDRDVVLRGQKAAESERRGAEVPVEVAAAVQVRLRCSRDSMAGTGRRLPQAVSMPQNVGRARRGVKRSKAPRLLPRKSTAACV